MDNLQLPANNIPRDIIYIDISGTVFKTQFSTLQSIPASRLASLQPPNGINGLTPAVYFYNRDADAFKHILNAYRSGQLHIPRDMCPEQFRREIEFWNIPLQMLAPCCWKPFYTTTDDINLTQALVKRLGKLVSNNVIQRLTQNNGHTNGISTVSQMISKKSNKSAGKDGQNTAKGANKVWLFLDDPTYSTGAKVWFFLYLAVVVLSILVVIFWMEKSCRVNPYLNDMEGWGYFDFNDSQIRYIMDFWDISENTVLLVLSDPHPVMFALDLFCMAFFVVETIVHFTACPWKRKYFKNIYYLLKIFLCVAMLVSLSLDVNKEIIDTQLEGNIYIIIRSFNVTRLLLIGRLHKLYVSLDILLLALKSSLRELLLLAFGFFICVIMYGSMMYSAQIDTEQFPTIWHGMWWAVITMTTVGYGDYFPTTVFGYIIGMTCAINGLVILAIPVAAIASNFTSFYDKHAEMRKHTEAIESQEKDSQLLMYNNGELVTVKDLSSQVC